VTAASIASTVEGSVLNARQARSCKHNDCDSPTLEILLVFQIRIGSHQHSKTVLLGRVKQLAVEWKTDYQHWEKGTAVDPFTGAAAKTMKLTYTPKQ
jgi:hypothetical protein